MYEIEYKNSKELGLKIFKDNLGFTVIRIAPKVKVRKSHGKKYPQFFNEDIESAYKMMIEFLTN